jgi:hypothetical protein
MKGFVDYINDKTTNEGLGGALSLITKVIQKKSGMAENTAKDLVDKLSDEEDSLGGEISKATKGKAKDLLGYWKYLKEFNPDAVKGLQSPVTYNKAILKNTANVTTVFKKWISSYDKHDLLADPIICTAISSTVKQYISVIESVIGDNKEKVQIANQLNLLHNLLSSLKIENNDAKKAIDDIVKELDGKAKELVDKNK